MITQSPRQLASKRCVACEGGISKYSDEDAQVQLESLSGWRLAEDGQRIEKHWHLRDFKAGMELLNRVAQLAEQEGHHPDLHLEGYRHVWIELWTHAVGGLTENDFILAAKIDAIPLDYQ